MTSHLSLLLHDTIALITILNPISHLKIILTRIMGLVVGAIAAQFMVSGIKGLWG